MYQLYLSWIEGDIGRAGKLERNLYQIMSRILAHMSTGISWYKLSRESGIASHATVQEYVDILQKMYVLHAVPFIDLSSKLPMYRKNRKLYFHDPLIFHCFYWQGQKEIYFVVKEAGNLHFFEIKYQEKVSINEFSWFTKLRRNEKLTVITKQHFEKHRSIDLIPVPIFLIQIGLN